MPYVRLIRDLASLLSSLWVGGWVISSAFAGGCDGGGGREGRCGCISLTTTTRCFPPSPSRPPPPPPVRGLSDGCGCGVVVLVALAMAVWPWLSLPWPLAVASASSCGRRRGCGRVARLWHAEIMFSLLWLWLRLWELIPLCSFASPRFF